MMPENNLPLIARLRELHAEYRGTRSMDVEASLGCQLADEMPAILDALEAATTRAEAAEKELARLTAPPTQPTAAEVIAGAKKALKASLPYVRSFPATNPHDLREINRTLSALAAWEAAQR